MMVRSFNEWDPQKPNEYVKHSLDGNMQTFRQNRYGDYIDTAGGDILDRFSDHAAGRSRYTQVSAKIAFVGFFLSLITWFTLLIPALTVLFSIITLASYRRNGKQNVVFAAFGLAAAPYTALQIWLLLT